MKAIATAERREFASMLRALLSAEYPVSLARGRNEPGADRSIPALWKALADAGLADLRGVVASARGRTLGVVVDARATGVTMEPLALAGGHRACTVRFDNVAMSAGALLDGDAARPALRRVANTTVALGSLDL